MKVSRSVKKSVEVGVKKMVVDRCRCRACVEEQTTISRAEAQSIDLAVEKLSMRQELSRLIHQVSRTCQDCDKKKLKSSIDKPGVEEPLRLLKSNFSRREKHKHECNQTCNSIKNPNNILISQKHLLTRKVLST